MTALLGTLVFLALFLPPLALVVGGRGQQREDRRVDLVRHYGAGAAPQGGPDAAAAASRASESVVVRMALRGAERAVGSRERRERLAARLDHAGMALRPHEWLALRASIALGTGAVAYLLYPRLLVLLAGAGLGWAAAAVYPRARTARRRRVFADDLTEMLQLVAGSLRSGFSLQQALDSAAKESRDPMGSELRRAIAEARFGTRLEDALDKISVRMDSDDFSWVVLAVRIQREVGGNLADILLTTAETLRERAFLGRHVKALSAEGRLSGYILIAMPIGIGVWMAMSTPEYMAPLYTTGIGRAMLAGMVVAMVIGWFWMQKTIKVKV